MDEKAILEIGDTIHRVKVYIKYFSSVHGVDAGEIIELLDEAEKRADKKYRVLKVKK